MRGVPWVTHLVTALLFAGWWTLASWSGYGVDTRHGWWDPALTDAAVGLVAVVTSTWGVLTAWVEAWAVRCARGRWVPRLLGVTYVLTVAMPSHFLAGFRLAGDTSPTDVDLLVFAWVTLAAMVALQLLLVRWMCRWRFPTTGHGSGRRLAQRLGLVE